MKLSDIHGPTVVATIEKMRDYFHTKDLSRHADMLDAHVAVRDERRYHQVVGMFLSRLARESVALLQMENRRDQKLGQLWRKLKGAPVHRMETFAARAGTRRATPTRSGGAVRPGHYETVAYMASPAFREIRNLYERYPEIGGVYFRPTDEGVVAVDLAAGSLKPRVGIGSAPCIKRGTLAAELEPDMPARIAHLREVRSRQKRASRENQLEARLIRGAQAEGLRLPGFPEYLRFIHSQWRVDQPGGQGQSFTDLLAVDLRRPRLVIIELKREEDHTAYDQARSYVRYFAKQAEELAPFFLRVARMMGQLYECPELAEVEELDRTPDALVAWPGSEGAIEVHPVDVRDAVAGPQCRSDPPFTARMRFHQSWYRARVLEVPCGTGPKQTDTTLYGNMLRKKDAARGANFLSPEIFAVARNRVAENRGAVEPYRLYHNLLSSQPMCFNLFGPLVADLDLATRVLRRLLPDEVEHVVNVEIEFAPRPASEYLDDRTAFDAFIEFVRPDGSRGFVGIETKLTEPFSQDVYDTPTYRRWSDRPDSPWLATARPKLADKPHNQLWRDHLLAVAMIRHPGSRWTGGYLMLVRHPADSECARVVDGYRELLEPGEGTFIDCPLDRLAIILKSVVNGADQQSWLAEFRKRYLDVSLSETEWQRWTEAGGDPKERRSK